MDAMSYRPWYRRLSVFEALHRLREFLKSFSHPSSNGSFGKTTLQLITLDVRNPPSDNITASALPLALTASTLAVELYSVGSWEASEDDRAERTDEQEKVRAELEDVQLSHQEAEAELRPSGSGGSVDPSSPATEPVNGTDRPWVTTLYDHPLTSWSDADFQPEDGPHTRPTNLPPLSPPSGGGGGGGGGLNLSSPTDEPGPTAGGGLGDDSSNFNLPANSGSSGRSGSDGGSGAKSIRTDTGSSVGHNEAAATTPSQVSHGSSTSVEPYGTPQFAGDLTAQPVSFVANAGQWASGIDFGVQGTDYQAWISAGSTVIELARATKGKSTPGHELTQTFDSVQLTWTGMSATPVGVGQDPLGSVSNFLIGQNSSQWQTNVPQFTTVRYASAWPGIDLVYQPASDGGLEYELEAQPGADLSAIGFTVTGASTKVVEGDLVLTAPGGAVLKETAPAVYQVAADGTQQPISGRYVLNADGSVGFQVGPHDTTRPIVIDPTLLYQTTFGSSGSIATGVASDASGNAYVVGYSTTGPDAFIYKFDPNGNLLWSTTFGGSGATTQYASGVAIGSNGNVYVSGTTDSTSFPTTTGAYQTTNAGGTDAFLTELSPDGTTTIFSTYLGGSGDDNAQAVAVDPTNGEPVIAGYTSSTNLPTTTAAFQSTLGGSTNAFLTRFSADGSSLVDSTYLGGSAADEAYGVAVDPFGDAIVVGETSSANFPTSQAYDPVLAGSTDAFVSEFDSSGNLYESTYYGGSGIDAAYGVAVDRNGLIYVTGSTTSTNLPLANPVQSTLSGSQNAFVAQFTAPAAAADYATYQDTGGGASVGYGIAVDQYGEATVVGASSDGLTIDRYVPGGSAIDFRVYGDTLGSAGYGAAVDDQGDLFAAGTTGSLAALIKFSTPPTPIVNGFSGGLTNNPTPTVTGTAQAGSTVTLYQQSTFDTLPAPVGTLTADTSGLWTYTFGSALADAQYIFTAVETTGTSGSGSSGGFGFSYQEISGGVSATSTPVTVTVDTQPPTINLSVSAATFQTQPQVTVSASDPVGFQTGTTVTLMVDQDNDGTFTDTGDASYATATLINGVADFTSYPALPTGATVEMEAVVADAAGNVGYSTPSDVQIGYPGSVMVPQFATVTPDTGASSTDQVTSCNTPTLSGTAQAAPQWPSTGRTHPTQELPPIPIGSRP